MAGDNNTLYEQVLGAEQSVIGSMLIDPKTVGLVVAELSEEDFSLEATRNLFRVFRKLYLENRIMDPVTVLAAIGPQDASMRSYVMELMDRTLTPANIVEYIEQVKRESLRLRLQNIGRELLERLSNPEDAMPLLMRGMELLSGQRQDDEADMERSILDFYEDLKHEPEYLPWGFPELDEGLYVERGDFVVLAGRPSDGKTALALHMAYAQAQTLNVGFFSLETGRKKLFSRLMSSVSRVPGPTLKRRKLSEEEFSLIAAGAGEIRPRKLRVIEAAGWTVDQIAARALARKLDVIYIDYLQLIRPTIRGRASRQDEVADISRALAVLARTHKITVVALSQLSRPADKTKRRPPVLADLRESGQIEQDADAVMFVWREDEQNSNAERTLSLAKNKEGQLNNWPMVFRGEIQRFIPITSPGSTTMAKKRQEPDYKQMGFHEITGDDSELPF